jgi:hypothetical protein
LFSSEEKRESGTYPANEGFSFAPSGRKIPDCFDLVALAA